MVLLVPLMADLLLLKDLVPLATVLLLPKVAMVPLAATELPLTWVAILPWAAQVIPPTLMVDTKPLLSLSSFVSSPSLISFVVFLFCHHIIYYPCDFNETLILP